MEGLGLKAHKPGDDWGIQVMADHLITICIAVEFLKLKQFTQPRQRFIITTAVGLDSEKNCENKSEISVVVV